MGISCSTAKRNSVVPHNTSQSTTSPLETEKPKLLRTKSTTPSIMNPQKLSKSSSNEKPPKRPVSVASVIKRPGSTLSRVSSDSSMASAVYSGVWEMMSITDFEKSIIANLWLKIISDNPYWTEGVYYRLFAEYPEMRGLFSLEFRASQDDETEDFLKTEEHLMLRSRASELRSLLDRLIIELQIDTDTCIECLQELGERHLAYLPEDTNPKKPKNRLPMNKEVWKRFIHAFLGEIRSTLDCVDVEEREMQILSWTHFISAIVSLLRQAYEDEFWRCAAMESKRGSLASGAGDNLLSLVNRSRSEVSVRTCSPNNSPRSVKSD